MCQWRLRICYKTQPRKSNAHCLLLCKLNTRTLYKAPLDMPVCISHAAPCWNSHWCEKHLRAIFPGLCISLSGFLSGRSEPVAHSFLAACHWYRTDETRCLSRSKQANSSITKKAENTAFGLFIGTSKFSSVINHSELPVCLRMAVLLKVKASRSDLGW